MKNATGWKCLVWKRDEWRREGRRNTSVVVFIYLLKGNKDFPGLNSSIKCLLEWQIYCLLNKYISNQKWNWDERINWEIRRVSDNPGEDLPPWFPQKPGAATEPGQTICFAALHPLEGKIAQRRCCCSPASAQVGNPRGHKGPNKPAQPLAGWGIHRKGISAKACSIRLNIHLHLQLLLWRRFFLK